MNKKDILNYLQEKNINYEITEHKAVYNMKDISEIEIPYKDSEAKNLFICDDKKTNYYLITIKGNKKADLKKIRQTYNARSLSFAKDIDLLNIMNLTPGSVTPFGLFNDKERKVKFLIDKELLNDKSQIIGVHPNDNTATVWLKTVDLIHIIEEHGNLVDIIDI